MKKICLDTSALIADPKCLFSFGDAEVIIPLTVLEELDNLKHKSEQSSKIARTVIRTLASICETGNVIEGVPINNGLGTLRVASVTQTQLNQKKKTHPLLNPDKPDNQILIHALVYDATLVTNDINLRIKCAANGISAQQLLDTKTHVEESDFYTGFSSVSLEPNQFEDLLETGEIDVSHLGDFYPNQFLLVKDCATPGASLITRVRDKMSFLIDVDEPETVHGLKPRNKEQKFALNLLLDHTIELVTLVAEAGCGKTLLAIAAGLDQLKSVNDNGRYEKLIVIRPIHPVGKDLGYMPGTFEEKMEPWITPIRDNFDFLTRNRKKRGQKPESYLDYMTKSGFVEIEAITFLRGRSVPNAYIIVDECQNISAHEMKTILTRAGEGTKIVCTGDIDQIDNHNLTIHNNGLSYVVDKFRNIDIAGHITLVKGERSKLASIASKIL